MVTEIVRNQPTQYRLNTACTSIRTSGRYLLLRRGLCSTLLLQVLSNLLPLCLFTQACGA